MTRSNCSRSARSSPSRPSPRHDGDVAPRLECGVHVVQNVRLVVDDEDPKALSWGADADVRGGARAAGWRAAAGR